MALVPASSRGGGLPSQWTVGSHGELTIAPNGGFAPVLTLQAAPGQLADGDELFSIKNDTPTQVFGVDAMGGAGFAMLSAPFLGGTNWQVDGGGIQVEMATTGAGTLSAIRSNTGFRTLVIQSGALPTIAPVSGTAFQCLTARDVFLVVPVTYNPGVATTATCKVELSPNDVIYSTLYTRTVPVGTVFDGQIDPVCLHVPGNWWVKLTVVNATLGTGTYY